MAAVERKTRPDARRRRRWIVIILTCAIGLLVVWPAADEYFALRDHRADLLQSLEEARTDAERLTAWRELASERALALSELDARTVGDDNAYELRNELVELVRRSACSLRRIELSPPARRPWVNDDDPLAAAAPSRKAEPTPYTLRTQRIVISASGPLANLQEVLAQLRKNDKLMHTRTFLLRPADEAGKEVIMELEVMVFGLEENANPASA